MPELKAGVVACDYDRDPDRFRANVETVEKYGLSADVHEEVADRLLAENLSPILDIGCGEGRLVRPVRARNLVLVALDRSTTMLEAVSAPRVLANAERLPFPDGYFGAVAALYMLYHLPDPRIVLGESKRVLRPGGLFIACAPSRYNDPELAAILPPSAMTFDAENGPDLVKDYLEIVELERWDAPLVHLPDHDALAQYLRGRSLSPASIARAVAQIKVPLNLTKRGVLIFGRKV